MTLSANAITKYYKIDRPIIRNLSYDFEANQIYAIKGESGSGKSTLLALLAGLLKPNDGKVLIDGEDIYQINEAKYLDIRSNTIGYIPQSNVLLKQYTVLENILLPYVLRDKHENIDDYEKRALYYLDKLGILQLKDSYPYEISGGEAKRVSIVRAMIIEPEFVIADEPTTGLDKSTGKIIYDFFDDYIKQGNTVIVATHDDQIHKYTEKIISLEK